MKELLQSLLAELKPSSLAAKATALGVLLTLAAIASVATVIAARPHFELLYSGLGDVEAAAIQRALAEAAVEYEVSQPPGPFVIHVQRGERYRAQNAVAASGALERSPRGIPGSESGLSTVFLSSGERQQMIRKREWEETEGMLEELDFVRKAVVRTSSPRSASPFADPEPLTASVTLHLQPGREPTPQQAESVADLVRYGLGVRRENLIVSDQHGASLVDSGAPEREDGTQWLASRTQHDRELEERVNAVLAHTFGPGRARVAVHSEWSTDQTVTRAERAENSKALLSETKRTSRVPGGGVPGGPAGTGANLAGGSETALLEAAASPAEAAETEDSRKEYVPSWVTTETRSTAPELARLSVSLFIDRSLADAQTQLQEVVQAAVGFDESRGDVFRSMPIAFPEPLVPEAGADEGDAVEEGSGWPAELLALGVEIVTALAFVLLLFKTLSPGSRRRRSAASAASAGEPTIDPEALARAEIETLVASDPERVSAILSRWVREEVRSA